MTARLATLALMTLGVGRALFWRGRLPERVASHFGPDGRADAFMTRDGFALFHVALVVGTGAVFLGIGALLRRTPDALINLPHKRYWLAPERREASLAALTGRMAWFGLGTQAFLFGTMHVAYAANAGVDDPAAARLDGPLFWTLFGLYLGGTALWTIALLRRFGAPPKGPEGRTLEA